MCIKFGLKKIKILKKIFLSPVVFIIKILKIQRAVFCYSVCKDTLYYYFKQTLLITSVFIDPVENV